MVKNLSENVEKKREWTDPVCVQDRRDCNRYNDGFCSLLTGTRFNKPCPFYKKEEKKNGSKT